MTYEEAVAAVTAPGQRYETERIVVDGVELTAFKNGPRSLRELFGTLREREGTFLVYEDERWSFADFVGRMDALGAALVERYGVRPGDRVAVGMRNYPEWVVAAGAALSVGAVLVSLNAWWTEDELDFALGDAEPTVLIADAERVARTRESCGRRSVPKSSRRDVGPFRKAVSSTPSTTMRSVSYRCPGAVTAATASS